MNQRTIRVTPPSADDRRTAGTDGSRTTAHASEQRATGTDPRYYTDLRDHRIALSWR